MIDLPASKPTYALMADGGRFPVRRIYCVGRNYAAHAREMGGDDRDPPFFFSKFPDALAISGSTMDYPPETQDLHHEGELVIALGRSVFRVGPDAALAAVAGYGAGLDMTRRDLQSQAREAGRPWDMAKNFSQSAILGPLSPPSSRFDPERGRIALTVNGETRQEADLSELIWSAGEVIAHLSRFDRLQPGDLIYTGTPAGVGAVSPGDRLEVTIEGLEPCRVLIGPPL